MKKLIRNVLYILSAAFFCAGIITVFLGAIPMHISWRTLGRRMYYFLYFGFSLFLALLGFTEWGFMLAGLSVIVGLNNECLDRGYSYFTSAFFSIGTVFGLPFLIVWFFHLSSGLSLLQEFQKNITTGLTQLKVPPDSIEVLSATENIVQIPSFIVFLLGAIILVTLVSEKKVFRWLEVPIPKRKLLSEFCVPNAVIWLFITSLLGIFLTDKTPMLQQISTNLFKISMYFYFFQGLAVIAKLFEVLKIPLAWWKWCMIVLFIAYFQFLPSLIGLLDFWIDFRKRFSKKKSTQLQERRKL